MTQLSRQTMFKCSRDLSLQKSQDQVNLKSKGTSQLPAELRKEGALGMAQKVVWTAAPGDPGEGSESKPASRAQARGRDRDGAVWDSVL